MDPDQCLTDILWHVRNYRESGGNPQSVDLEDLIDRIEALDDWMSSQGFLPESWAEWRNLPPWERKGVNK